MAAPIFVATLFAILSLGTAHAGNLQDLAGDVEKKIAAGNHMEAIAEMREAFYAVWQEAPLSFQKAQFVSDQATGYGIYNQRASNIFKQGEKMLVYVEPVGFGWRQEGDAYGSDMSADFELRTPSGKILAGQKGFGAFKLKGYHRNTEYYVNLTYNLKGLPPGQYIIGTTFHDKVTGQSADFDLPFEVK